MTSISTPLVWLFLKPQVLFKIRTWLLLILRIWLLTIYTIELARHLCTSLKKPSGYDIYLCFVYLSRYEVIILKHHLVTKSELLIGCNQMISSFMQLSTLLLILIRVLVRWQRSIFSLLLVLGRVLAKWQKYIFDMLSVVVKVLTR